MKNLWLIFSTILGISATTNGGYAIVAAMKEKFVNKHHLLTEEEIMSLMSLGQTAPGPIAINTSIMVGYKISGIIGSIVALLAVILPPMIIMTLVTIFYNYVVDNVYIKLFLRGMQAGVTALILSILIDMFFNIKKEKSIVYFILAAISLVIARFTNISIFFVAIFCAIVGYIKIKITTKGAIDDD